MHLRHILLLALGLPGAAYAQNPWQFTYTMEARPRLELRDNRDFDSDLDDDRRDLLIRARLSLQARNPDEGLTFFYQPQLSYANTRLRGDTDDSSYLGNHQMYAQWQPPTAKEWMLRAGRQELVFGNERLVGAFGWDNVGRSFDGVRADYTRGTGVTSAWATELGQFPTRPTRPKFYGAYHTRKLQPTHTLDLYALYKHDRARSGEVVTETDVYTLGTRSQRKWADGPDYLAEAAFQFGETGARDISAWAFSVNTGYTFQTTWTPRVAVEYNSASGGDPADPDDVRTFDQLFPTNHDKYGIADYQGWRNMRNLRLATSARPSPEWTVNLDYHWFWLQNRRDFWYGLTGRPNIVIEGTPRRDPTGASGRNIGQEIDLWANYTATPDLAFSGGLARFEPGSYVRQVSGDADASMWWYLQATWKR